MQEAVDLLPEGSAGRERVEETRDYFRFIQEDAIGLDAGGANGAKRTGDDA